MPKNDKFCLKDFCKDIKCPEYIGEGRNDILNGFNADKALLKLKCGKYTCEAYGKNPADLDCMFINCSGNINILDVCGMLYPEFIIDEFKILCAKIKHNI